MSLWAWSRLWRSAGALASSMVATVARFGSFDFCYSGNRGWFSSGAVQLNGYSAEEVLLGQSATLEDDSDGQLLTTSMAERNKLP